MLFHAVFLGCLIEYLGGWPEECMVDTFDVWRQCSTWLHQRRSSCTIGPQDQCRVSIKSVPVFSYAVELGQLTMLIYPVRYVLPHIFACLEFPLEGKIRSLFCFDKIYIFAKLQLGHLDGLTSFRVQRCAGQGRATVAC